MGWYKHNLKSNEVIRIKNGYDINELLVFRVLKICDLLLYVCRAFDFTFL